MASIKISKIMIELAEHQVNASNYMATTPTKAGIIAHVTGSGKSVTTISGALKIYAYRHVKKHIFVATVSSISEIMADMEQHFNYRFIHINKDNFEDFMLSNKVFAILTYGELKKIDPFLINTYFERTSVAMYFDEAHELKNEATIGQKHVKSYRDNIDYLFLVTATPVLSSAKDLQGLFWLINPNLFGTEEQFYKVFSKYRMICYIRREKLEIASVVESMYMMASSLNAKSVEEAMNQKSK